MTEREKVAKIVDLREGGYTWWEIDQVIFPNQVTKEQCYGGKSPSYKLAKKANAPAFSKTVIGIFTPTQIVVPLRKFDPHQVQSVSMVTDGGF